MPELLLIDLHPDVVRKVRWKPRYRHGVEQEVYTRIYPDGRWRWFGSGWAVADVRTLPITLRLPFRHTPRGPVWGIGAEVCGEAAMALRKIIAGPALHDGGKEHIRDQDTYTQIVEYLTAAQYPDGTPREKSTLIIVADRDGWRGCLSDKDNQRSLWRAATTVAGLLEAIELALMEDDPHAWRQSYDPKKPGRKRA